MGCSNSNNKKIIYSKVLEKDEENNNSNQNHELYVNTNFPNYSITETEFANKTFIKEVLKSMEIHKKNNCLGYRKPIEGQTKTENKYTFFTNEEIKNYSEYFSKNLIKCCFCPIQNFEEEKNPYKFLGLFAKNCVEWIISDLACQMNSITSVTFYSTLGDQAFEYISNQTNLSTICLSEENVETFLKYIEKYSIKNIKNVIAFDLTLLFSKSNFEKLKEKNFNVISFKELIQYDKNMDKISLNLSESETICTICYTSGTTGIPKGVKLTQNNLISQLENMKDSELYLSEKDTLFIYLPLAHIMERIETFLVLISGAKGGVISGDPKSTLLEDIEILKPTILLTVPRILSLFRTKILDSINKLPEGCKKNLAQKALRSKREKFKKSKKIKSFLYDLLVFKKVKNKFGGKIRAFITGSAPLSQEIANDIKAIFGVPIIEGYGLTECSGAAAGSNYADFENSCTGGPIKTCKIKLEDVPELNYHRNTLLDNKPSPTGEVCLKGLIIFNGYFRNLEATNECFDKDGWFHTGDIGRILPDNKGLKIIDRKKEIFKLSQGEYIAPSKLEGGYGKSKYVQTIFVYGNSLESFLIAIIVPNKDNVFDYLKLNKNISALKNKESFIDVENFDKYLNEEDMKILMKNELDEIAKENNFNSLEKIRKFFITEKEFLISNGCFTPTLKLIRNNIVKMFEKEIEEMYKE